MGFYTPAGQRITKAGFPATAVPDPLKVVTADVYESVPYGPGDKLPEGSRRHLRFTAGTILPTSTIDRLFPPATVTTITPATGPAAGGTTVTIKGTNLDGVSAVNFGASAGTELRVISTTELRVKTPAVAAGAVNVVVADDAGNVTKNAGFTFA